MPRFQKHIFICNNKRSKDDPRDSCFQKGSNELIDYAKQRIHELGLKGIVRVNKAGCLDSCSRGPAMVIYPEDTWYSPKTKDDIEIIITDHIQKNQIVEKLQIKFSIKP